MLRIIYDYKKDDEFYIHIPKKVNVKFQHIPEGLYYININTLNNYNKQIRETDHVVSTVWKTWKGLPNKIFKGVSKHAIFITFLDEPQQQKIQLLLRTNMI